ncbi:hypothetical protein AD998_14025 [bacterium 336/3]|nr:hypothetical protein AD998_14025 [bacterium 336/3]
MLRFFSCFLFILLISSCSETKEQDAQGKEDTIASNLSTDSSSSKTEDPELEEFKVNDAQKKGIMLNIVRQYCQSIAEKDYKKLESLFADSVNQYAFLKNTTKEQIALEMKRFYAGKKDIRLVADYGEMKIKDYTLNIPIFISWEKYKADTQAEIIFDKAFNMVSFTEKPYIKAKEGDKVKNWAGKYVIEGGRQEEAFLEITAISAKKLEFSIRLAENGDCKGTKFEGTAIILSDTEASTTESEDCKMSFILEKEQITLKEVPGCTAHKIACSFEGIYTKKSK